MIPAPYDHVPPHIAAPQYAGPQAYIAVASGGGWVDCDVDHDELAVHVAGIAGLPGEFAIAAYVGFEGYVPAPDAPLLSLCTVGSGIDAHGPAFAWFARLDCCDLSADTATVMAAFEAAYVGEWDSADDFACHKLGQMCDDFRTIERYVSVDADILVGELDYTVSEHPDGFPVYIFDEQTAYGLFTAHGKANEAAPLTL